MRVRIIVEADRLGDVDVTRENYYRQIDADPKDVLHGVLSDAVAQIQDAYRLRPLWTRPNRQRETRRTTVGEVFNAKFNDDDYYEFAIDDYGPIVYSECCADRMTLDVARKVRNALTAWIDKQEASTPALDPTTGEPCPTAQEGTQDA